MKRLTEQEAYERLADFIKDYIYDRGWEHLSSMQIRAIGEVLEKRRNLLFTAGTAMGKTEAALMPALTDIYEHPADSVGILYISPLKALINDQFYRIEEMLAGTGLAITKWHGDAAVSRKEKLLGMPGGILQTTPESLEAMLCRHPENVRILFSGLRYIVMDEIHYFMGNQRGLQLLALLERIQRIIGKEPVRLGLSATIGDCRQAIAYLNAGSRRQALVIGYEEERRQYLISVTATRIGNTDYPAAYGKKILEQSVGKRTLLFTNSRRECEILVAQVRRLALKAGLPDCYYIHHGSISRELREEAERRMKRSAGPVMTGTTLTLELGIDIGDLDEVIQASQPLRISSMVQRVGRSGRKTMRSSIAFHLRYFEAEGGVLENLDLSLVRTIAMIELYFREKYVEPAWLFRYPMNLLIHETLSILCQKGCLYPQRLAAEVLELSIFRHISQEELRQVLRSMMEKDYIKVYEDGAVGISDAGERLCGSLEFYAVFESEETFSVRWNDQEIGTVDRAYKAGDSFFLAGRTWEVRGCDTKHRRIDVEPGTAQADIRFGGKGALHTDQRTMERIHQVLASKEMYSYLDEEAVGILTELRAAAEHLGLLRILVQEPGTDNLLVFPVLSTDTIRTLYYIWNSAGVTCDRVMLRGFLYGIRIHSMTEAEFRACNARILKKGCRIHRAFLLRKERMEGKYFDILPEELRYKELVEDLLDQEGAAEFLKMLAQGEECGHVPHFP